MKKATRAPISLLLWLFGMLLSVGAPIIATVSYFPIWISEGGEAMISGFTLLLLLLCALPLYRQVKRGLASPSGITVWLVLFLMFFALSRIAAQMTVISFVGLSGNIVGGILFKIRERLGRDTQDEQ